MLRDFTQQIRAQGDPVHIKKLSIVLNSREMADLEQIAAVIR